MNEKDKLVWELFLLVKELMPVTAENTRRQNDWAMRFNELDVAAAAPDRPDYPTQTSLGSPPPEDAGLGDNGDDDEVNEHPAAHAARSVGKRKKK
jgi:hypothetical protein